MRRPRGGQGAAVTLYRLNPLGSMRALALGGDALSAAQAQALAAEEAELRRRFDAARDAVRARMAEGGR